MSRATLERRLADVAQRRKQLSEDLRVATEQHRQLAEDADEARLRALVSESPLAERERKDAQRHADALSRHRDELVEQIARLERTQDDLLDRLLETMGPASPPDR